MIDLYTNDPERLVGSMTEDELRQLVDALEEESPEDQDYYIDAATIDVVAQHGASGHLLQLLRDALGGAEGVDIRWQRR